ncbi:MAG: CCA tRNA nucleotidyltransferase [Rhizobiales bacterium]|nr:CCA tRNA nucleotidyltransferase [Hyphomicrobiales bacterium]
MAPRRKPPELPSLAHAEWLKDQRLQTVLALLNSEGGEARVAGGAVRNALLGVPVADIDIATTLRPEEVARRGKAKGLAVHPTGIEHGTVTLVVQRMPFEVTTLRRDVSTDGRRATVAFTGDWEEDASRRDFTINAMYCDAGGKIYDFTNGYADIQKRKVRFVGLPSRRIKEDYLRILRFFRFHAGYAVGTPDVDGLAACVRLRRGLSTLSAERVRQELLKLLVAPGAVAVLKVMAKTGILAHVIPAEPNWRTLGRLPPDAILRLSAIARTPTALRDRLRLSNDECRRLQAITEAPPITPDYRPDERRRILYHIGPQGWRDAALLSLAQSRAPLDDAAWQELVGLPGGWPLPKFPVSGRDLQALGFLPGPALGEALRKLEDWWIASDFKPTREELLLRAKP